MTDSTPNPARAAAPGRARDDRAADRLRSLFPDPTAPKPFWRTRWARLGLVGTSVIALLASGAVAASASGSTASAYRTAVVGHHDVEAHTVGVATVEPTSQAAVAFPVAGNVAAVSVAVGDRVAIGDELATLDTAALEVTLHQRQATLAAAELELAEALDAESTSSTSSSGASNTPTSAAVSPTTAASAPATGAGSDELAAAQLAVVDGQRSVDAALTAASAALDASDVVCDAEDAVASAADTAGTAETSSTSTSTSTSTSVVPTTVAVATTVSTSCRSALRDVRQAQASVQSAQAALAQATSTLDGLPRTSTTASPATSAAVTPTTAVPRTTAATAGPAGGGTVTTGTVTTGTPSAESLIAMQKAIDAAALDVIVATAALQQARIVSPISGTVAGVAIAAGDSVTAASSTATVTIVGQGGYEVTTSVAVGDLAAVELGQDATVQVDGTDTELTGEVVAIGVSPSSSTSTYQVTIGLAEPDVDLPNGATGSVSIVTGSTAAALAVPTSAVATDGDRHTVVVYDGAATADVEVEIGVMGGAWTEIRDGLTAGQEVVLADLDAALPGSATDVSGEAGTLGSSGFPGSGAFPGGGNLPTGGFPGPPG